MTAPLDEKGRRDWSKAPWRAPHFETARRKTRTAIKQGILVRPDTCERCGNTPPRMKDGRASIQAHHHDYSKPLDVQWLCYSCHREETPAPVGCRAPAAKLDYEKAAFIRAEYASGSMGTRALAEKFGVNTTTILHVIRGDTWK